MLRPFFDNIRVSLLRNIRIPQNLGNRFAHAFASCTRPSRLGLEFESRWYAAIEGHSRPPPANENRRKIVKIQ